MLPNWEWKIGGTEFSGSSDICNWFDIGDHRKQIREKIKSMLASKAASKPFVCVRRRTLKFNLDRSAFLCEFQTREKCQQRVEDKKLEIVSCGEHHALASSPFRDALFSFYAQCINWSLMWEGFWFMQKKMCLYLSLTLKNLSKRVCNSNPSPVTNWCHVFIEKQKKI